MTKLLGSATADTPLDMSSLDWTVLLSAPVTSSSPTKVILHAGGTTFTLKGAFTAFDGDGRPTAGSLSALTATGVLGTQYALSNVTMSVPAFFGFLSASDMTGLEAALFPGNDTFSDTPYNDTLLGLGGNDKFDLTAFSGESLGGIDTILGGDGNDQVMFGGNLSADDSVDGGAGNDTVTLDGNYSFGVAFRATTLVNVETLSLAAGHSYTLKTHDATVGIGQVFQVRGDTLGSFDSLNFDGGSESNGSFAVTGGAGADMLRGGAKGDTLVGGDGNDTLYGDPGAAGAPQMVSTNQYGQQDSTGGSYVPVFSPNDHRVAFYSSADNLVPGDANGTFDVFVKDVDTGAITLVSTDALGNQQDATDISSLLVKFTPDGGHVLFTSRATNLVAGQNDGGDLDVFLKDLTTGAISLVSSDLNGNDTGQSGPGNGDLYFGDVSPDGTLVTLYGNEAMLDGTFDVHAEVYGKNLATGAVTLLSATNLGVAGNQSSFGGVFSPDGSKLLFTSDATNFVSDHNSVRDVFLKDLTSGVVTRVSTTSLGLEANGTSAWGTFSPDSTKVLFSSTASNLVSGDNNGAMDVFVKDLATGAVTLVSANSAGQIGSGGPSGQFSNPVFSPDGTKVAFDSYADNLVAGDTDGHLDVFVKDLVSGQIARVSTDAFGTGGNDSSYYMSFSADGQLLVFASDATNFAPDANNPFHQVGVGRDVFVVEVPVFGSGNDVLNGGAGDDTLYGMGSDDTLTGGAGNDTMFGGDGADHIVDLGGTDYAEGNAGNDSFTLGGIDTAFGGDGNDQFTMGATLDALDVIDGGAGNDTMTLSGAYATLDVLGAASFTGIETLKLSGAFIYKLQSDDGNVEAGANLTVDTTGVGVPGDVLFDGAAENDGRFTFLLGASTAWVSGGGGNDQFVRTAPGAYTLFGQGGDDQFKLKGSFSSAATLDGGSGVDTVVLNGDYAAGVTFASATLRNVESLVLAGGHSYDLTTHDATVAAGQSLIVFAAGLTAGDSLHFNGAAEEDGVFQVAGGAGNDDIAGGAGNDALSGSAGNDVLVGNAGNDTITDGLGDDTVQGNAGDDLMLLSAGGNDGTSGGDGNDTFQFGAAFTAADRIDGGAGSDTLALNGNYAAQLVFAADTMVNVESLTVGAGHNYWLVMNGATLAAGQALTVDAHALASNNSLRFDASADGDGRYVVTGGDGKDILSGGGADDILDGGKGDDTLTGNGGGDALTGGDGNDTLSDTGSGTELGGAGNDQLYFRATASDPFTAAAIADGGAGNDILTLEGDITVVFAASTMTAVETLRLWSGHNYDITLDDASVGAGKILTVDATLVGAGNAEAITATAENDGRFILQGGAGSDTFAAGAGNDTLDGSFGDDVLSGNGGNDKLTGDAGDDALTGNEGNDVLAGGNGNDQLLGGNGGDSLDGGSGDDDLEGGDGNDQINAAADGNETVLGGTGNDTVTFGAFFTTTDHVDGGAGNDTLVLEGSYNFNSTSGGLGGILGIENITLLGTFDYTLSLSDADIASGAHITIDASAVVGSVHLSTAADTDGAGATLIGNSQGSDLRGGAGDDTLIGGDFNDTMYGFGGHDTMKGGFGSDDYVFFGAGAFNDGVHILDVGDSLDTDTLELDTGCTVVLKDDTLQGVEVVKLLGTAFDLTFADGNYTVLDYATIDATGAGTAKIDASAESSCKYVITSAIGNDVLKGGGGSDDLHSGGGNDTLQGGLGQDILDGGSGADTYVFNNVVESASALGDIVQGFKASDDRFDMPFAVSGVTFVTTGTASYGGFDSDLATALGGLGAHAAAVFTPDTGDRAGQTILVIDANGVAGYQSGADYVVFLDGTPDMAGFGTGNFI